MSDMDNCCCGLSIRAGTFVILIFTLLYGLAEFLFQVENFFEDYYLIEPGIAYTFVALFLVTREIPFTRRNQDFLVLRSIYNTVDGFVSVMLSIFGLIGVSKGEPKYLVGIYFYFLYEVIYRIVILAIFLIDPITYKRVTGIDPNIKVDSFTTLIMLILLIACSVYFAEVIKSYYKYLKREQELTRGLLGSNAITNTTIVNSGMSPPNLTFASYHNPPPYPVTLSYNNPTGNVAEEIKSQEANN